MGIITKSKRINRKYSKNKKYSKVSKNKKSKKRKQKQKRKQKGKGYTFGFTNNLGKEPALVKYGMEYSPVYPGSKLSGSNNNSCEVKFVKNMNSCIK
tara:strand:+ start:431 stop:721 length:291 start_codon:yes stop_codon:yes gene_type:complete